LTKSLDQTLGFNVYGQERMVFSPLFIKTWHSSFIVRMLESFECTSFWVNFRIQAIIEATVKQNLDAGHQYKQGTN